MKRLKPLLRGNGVFNKENINIFYLQSFPDIRVNVENNGYI